MSPSDLLDLTAAVTHSLDHASLAAIYDTMKPMTNYHYILVEHYVDLSHGSSPILGVGKSVVSTLVNIATRNRGQSDMSDVDICLYTLRKSWRFILSNEGWVDLSSISITAAEHSKHAMLKSGENFSAPTQDGVGTFLREMSSNEIDSVEKLLDDSCVFKGTTSDVLDSTLSVFTDV